LSNTIEYKQGQTQEHTEHIDVSIGECISMHITGITLKHHWTIGVSTTVFTHFQHSQHSAIAAHSEFRQEVITVCYNNKSSQ
jgi:hypothetical protein